MGEVREGGEAGGEAGGEGSMGERGEVGVGDGWEEGVYGCSGGDGMGNEG